MAPELKLAKLKIAEKKRHFSWLGVDIDCSAKGGIYAMGWPKVDRRHDSRRTRANDSGIRGLRTVRIEGDLMLEIRERRSMLGNRNGSEKVQENRESERRRLLPRATRKQNALRKLQEELAAEEALEMERRQEEIKRQLAEDKELAREEEWFRNWFTESERRERERELQERTEDPPAMEDDSPWIDEGIHSRCC